ncbi:MAG: YggS family pyridoxal phosphate-dependent enzyme [Bdellovibrionales bacterium]|nr:YggS family pyridoxal phosphate-dependent enzyme [Bdellovibrionales bacterium]
MAGKSVRENWFEIKAEMKTALVRAGRTEDSARIVGVAKGQSIARIQEAVAAGLKIVGENYVQEYLKKVSLLGDPQLEWHFIGHIQSNKVRDLVGKIDLIHSVDRVSIAQLIGQRAAAQKLIQKILVEINIDDEPNKSGIDFREGRVFLEALQKIDGIKICGLMALPAPGRLPEETRRGFARLRHMRDEWTSEVSGGSAGHHLHELSMGTSQDFQYALEEGATYIRLGTRLFGERQG